MDYLLTISSSFILLISLINFLTIRTPSKSSQIQESLTVIVPLRNEANNIAELVASLRDQENLAQVEFLLLDDNSEDDTFVLLEQSVSGLSNFHILRGNTLPQGWIGKTWALQQLLEKSSGEIIVSIDADVRLTSDAISKAVTLLKKAQLDFLSPYPKQLAFSWSERLIQPLLQWSWMSTVILRVAEKSSLSSTVVANGQFFVVKRTALDQVNGYEAVRNKVLDDVVLARSLVKSGSRGCVANGATIASTHMYSSWREIKAGYGKSLHAAFGSLLGSGIAIVFVFLTGIAPFIAGIAGSSIGWYAFGAVTLTRALSAIKVGKSGLDALLHPISSALLIYLIIYSWKMRGQVQWKGRTL
jgi:glycosyltransferase involved in cell wall biosynthesis